MLSRPRHVAVTLTVGSLNAPIKTMSEWGKTQNPAACYLQEAHFKHEDTWRTKGSGWRNTHRANDNLRSLRVATFISDRDDVEARKVTRGKRALQNDKGVNSLRHNYS